MNKGKFQQLILLVTILMSLVFPGTVLAATQGTESQQEINQPEISVDVSTSDLLELTIRFPSDPLQKTVDDQTAIFNEAFYNHPSDAGVPDLPVLYEDIEIPTGEGVEFEILDSISYTANLGEGNLPASIPTTVEETEKCIAGELCGVKNASLIQQTGGIYPETPAQLLDTYILRGHQVAQLAFWPVQYDPLTQTVQIYEQLTVRLTIPGAESRGATVVSTQASEAFEAIAAESLLNYLPQVQPDAERSIGGDGYLIIAPDSYIPTLQPLVDLKTSQGFSVTVAGFQPQVQHQKPLNPISKALITTGPSPRLMFCLSATSTTAQLPCLPSPVNLPARLPIIITGPLTAATGFLIFSLAGCQPVQPAS